MSYFNQFKDEINNDGFFILKTKFSTGQTTYEVVKQEAEGLKLVSGRIARNVAKKLEKETGKPIQLNPKEATACNFDPVELPKDQVQVFINDNYPDNRIHNPAIENRPR